MIRKFFRFFIALVLVGILIYGALIFYVWIRERQVSHDVSEVGEYDAVIILGAQVRPDGTPSVQLSWRLDAAAEAFAARSVPIVLCGAQGADEPMTEAEAMKRYLLDKGIPSEFLLLDDASFNTRQNLRNAQSLLQERADVGRVLIVSSDYHVPRAIALAGDLGLDATGLGSPCLPEYWIKNHAREALAWVKYWGEKILGK